MADDSPQAHSSNHIAMAFLIAPAMAGVPVGLVLTLASPKIAMMATALISAWAYPVVGIFAVPIYFVLRRRVAITPRNSAAVGAVVGIAATALLLAAATPELRQSLYLSGLIGWPAVLGVAAICGAVAGLAFWGLVKLQLRKPASA